MKNRQTVSCFKTICHFGCQLKTSRLLICTMSLYLIVYENSNSMELRNAIALARKSLVHSFVHVHIQLTEIYVINKIWFMNFFLFKKHPFAHKHISNSELNIWTWYPYPYWFCSLDILDVILCVQSYFLIWMGYI